MADKNTCPGRHGLCGSLCQNFPCGGQLGVVSVQVAVQSAHPSCCTETCYPLASSCSPGSPTRTQGDRCRQSRRCRIDRCGAVGVENDLHCACKFYTHGPTSLGRSPTTAQRAWGSRGSANPPFPVCPCSKKDGKWVGRDSYEGDD